MMINTRIATPFGYIYGSYKGREYIDLSFGIPHRPVEVINVFDYAEGCPVIEATDEAVRQAMRDWLCYLDIKDLENYFQLK